MWADLGITVLVLYGLWIGAAVLLLLWKGLGLIPDAMEGSARLLANGAAKVCGASRERKDAWAGSVFKVIATIVIFGMLYAFNLLIIAALQ